MDGENENPQNNKKKDFKLEINFDEASQEAAPSSVPGDSANEASPGGSEPDGNQAQQHSETGTNNAKTVDSAAAGKPEQNGGIKKQPPKKVKRKGLLNVGIYAAIVVVASILIAMLLISAMNDVLGLYKPDKQVDIEVPQGATALQVAKILKKSGVIRYETVFRLYVKYNKPESFQYGDFMLNEDMGYEEVVKTLTSTKQNRAMIKVTIPEGYTMRQIASLLEKNKVCTSDSFLNACEDDSYHFTYNNNIPKDSKRFYKLEGYLFPDTYNFMISSPPHTIVQKMLDNFADKFTSAMAEKAKASNMTVDQAITLASIIQAEAGKKSEMSKVSSVFHNRLTKGQGSLKLLQSDATVLYIYHTSVSSQPVDISVNSPYNTYKNIGLPPGPIGNPGLDAISAALSPNTTDYYYFVTDATGKYYYSKTFAEHQRAVLKAKAHGSATGTDISGNE